MFIFGSRRVQTPPPHVKQIRRPYRLTRLVLSATARIVSYKRRQTERAQNNDMGLIVLCETSSPCPTVLCPLPLEGGARTTRATQERGK